MGQNFQGRHVDAARDMAGALLIDKPAGPTSHDIVAFVRRTLQISRVGHTGTLDPLATGLLIVLVGQATRMAQFLAADEKEYVADIRLGVSTPTYDAASLAEAVRRPIGEGPWPTDADLDVVLARFRGSFLQTPPPFSAKKVAGVAAYERARKREAVALKPASVNVRTLQVLPASTVERGLLRVRVVASAGFYVRSLAHDIGETLGCGAHLEALRRIGVGQFRVAQAIPLDEVEQRGTESLIPVNSLLGEMPSIALTPDGVRRAVHGNPLAAEHTKNRDSRRFAPETAAVPVLTRLVDDEGALLAVAERRGDGLLHPLVVLR